jgi:hypothetical protein
MSANEAPALTPAQSNGLQEAFGRAMSPGPNGNWDWGATGLAKREYIAARLLASSMSHGWTPKEAAQRAVQYADALLTELAKVTP